METARIFTHEYDLLTRHEAPLGASDEFWITATERNTHAERTKFKCHVVFLDEGAWRNEILSIEDAINRQPRPQVQLIFVDTVLFERSETLRQKYFQHCGIPDWQWSLKYRRCNGAFGSSDEYDDDGQLVTHETWFMYLIKHVIRPDRGQYKWNEMMFHTIHDFHTSQTIISCLDTPEFLRKAITKCLVLQPEQNRAPDVHDDVYSLHLLLLDAVHAIYDESIWTLRGGVRSIEQSRSDPDRTETDFPYLHEMARHTIHSAETLGIAVQTTTDLLQQHEELYKLVRVPTAQVQASISTGATADGSIRKQRRAESSRRKMTQRLRFQLQMMKSLHARSLANRDRLQNELTLAFNIVTQRDSRATVSLGRSAASNSAAMKTIAYVTLVFLPATFVSAIFSTSFFTFSNPSAPDPSSSSWAVSSKFWIYWAVALPLTIATMGVWLWWERRFLSPINPMASEKRARTATAVRKEEEGTEMQAMAGAAENGDAVGRGNGNGDWHVSRRDLWVSPARMRGGRDRGVEGEEEEVESGNRGAA